MSNLLYKVLQLDQSQFKKHKLFYRWIIIQTYPILRFPGIDLV